MPMLCQPLGFEEGRVFSVLPHDVLNQPVLEEAHDLHGEHHLLGLEIFLEGSDLRHELLVRELVRRGLSVLEFGKILLFGLKMSPGIRNETIDNITENLLRFPFNHRVVQLVDEMDQLLMLPVDFSNIQLKALAPFN